MLSLGGCSFSYYVLFYYEAPFLAVIFVTHSGKLYPLTLWMIRIPYILYRVLYDILVTLLPLCRKRKGGLLREHRRFLDVRSCWCRIVCHLVRHSEMVRAVAAIRSSLCAASLACLSWLFLYKKGPRGVPP